MRERERERERERTREGNLLRKRVREIARDDEKVAIRKEAKRSDIRDYLAISGHLPCKNRAPLTIMGRSTQQHVSPPQHGFMISHGKNTRERERGQQKGRARKKRGDEQNKEHMKSRKSQKTQVS